MVVSNPKVWLITGAATGFGRCLALTALSRGDRVVATARCLEKLHGLPCGPNLHLLALDVDDEPEEIRSKVDQAASIWGTIDVLVNNAGTGLTGLLEEGGVEQMVKQYRTNVFGQLAVTTAVLPYMRTAKRGTVVVLGSRSAWKTEIGVRFYASSKAAIHAMSESLAVELKPFNIRVLIVEPGSFRTKVSYAHPFFSANPIPDYDESRKLGFQTFAAHPEKFRGDPSKAMNIVVDVVRGEGVATGKPFPLYLVLGEDAETDIRTKCAKVLDHLDEWKSVLRTTDFE
ncbi:NAD(P)-binding protein [Leucogyrophana mollusca]|uniref:NAD(P)-binding protein n=1 Tax=Leucogyrophana mollusca TaxID=85980 RepID=A0ACB8BHZ4_9AGAM|nr:NAD(P)-binding protein [Leucogyrophana mollusca]